MGLLSRGSRQKRRLPPSAFILASSAASVALKLLTDMPLALKKVALFRHPGIGTMPANGLGATEGGIDGVRSVTAHSRERAR
jgi:hypothetical protein